MKRREQILKEAAARLEAKQKRQQRRRLVTYRRPWGTWPKSEPGRTSEELRRLDALDVSLTLHCAALYLMAPPAGE